MKKQESIKRRLLKQSLAITLCMPLISSCSSTVFIVVHGTWGRESEWYLPQGDFFDALEVSAEKLKAKVISFTWSGGNNNYCRQRAAKSLSKLIQSYPSDTHINLVTHSHGSNVGIVASQLLAAQDNSKFFIEHFYALGTPVDANWYTPDMHAIHWFYHFFSLGDLVQPVFGLFDRCYPQHERTANIRVIINNKNPGHKELHSPLIATWLPAIHRMFAQQKIKGFENFNFQNPGLITFNSQELPHYEIDNDRAALLQTDQQKMIAIRHAITCTSERGRKIPVRHQYQ